MAKKETNKKPLFGNIRSHALNATRRKQKLNMQKVVNEKGETVLMTAREAKKFKKDQIKE
jgi:ribosomal protein L28